MNNLYAPGRIIVKLAGRDAGRIGLILAVREDGRVLVDGAVRRRYVNPQHLEPLPHYLKDVDETLSHEHVITRLQEAGFEVFPRKNRSPKAPPSSSSQKASKKDA